MNKCIKKYEGLYEESPTTLLRDIKNINQGRDALIYEWNIHYYKGISFQINLEI